MQRYLLNNSSKVIVIPEGAEIDMTKDHPVIGSTKHGDLLSSQCIIMTTTKQLDQRLTYNHKLEIINDLTPDSPAYIIDALLKQDLQTLDPMLSHIARHERNNETAAAARAEAAFAIAQAEILEKYGKGTTVYVTKTGSCYHTAPDCPAITNSTTAEINLSDGLKHYSPCSLCCL